MNPQIIDVTQESFSEVVINGSQQNHIVVDFWSPSCNPCKQLIPLLENFSADFGYILAKVNTEDEQELASHFQIRSIPTLMIFRDNIIVFSQPGALPEAALNEIVGKVKALDMDEVRKQVAEQEKANA